MEIKGIISLGETKHLTCCDTINDLIIGDQSLHELLDDYFDLDPVINWENSDIDTPCYFMRYLILEQAPKKVEKFDKLAGEFITSLLCGDYVHGCYSEWTCGYGGFDYVVGEGHSIFDELKLQVGKYVHIKLSKSKN